MEAYANVVGRPHLQSADTRLFVMLRTQTLLGTLNFMVDGTRTVVWNSLPVDHHRSASISLRSFIGRLNKYFFELPRAHLRINYCEMNEL